MYKILRYIVLAPVVIPAGIMTSMVFMIVYLVGIFVDLLENNTWEEFKKAFKGDK